MNRLRARVFSLLAALTAVGACGLSASAQEHTPALWFQGTRLILEHPVPMDGDIAVSGRDPGLRRFLDKLGATLSYQPQQRYAVVTAQDRRTIVFTLGDTSYTAGGVRAQAPFAPLADGGDVVLPFFALARALYVEPVADGGETVLQPRVGALDVRADGPRTVVTVRAAMPLVVATDADATDRLQLSFAGLGTSLASSRRLPAPAAVQSIGFAVRGTARVPVTTLILTGAEGSSHRIVPSAAPGELTVVFEPRSAVGAIPPPPPFPGATPTPAPLATAPPPIVAGRTTVTDVQIGPGPDDALAVRISLSGQASYQWHRLADNRWYLDFPNATLAGPGRDERPSFGAVQAVRVRQTGSSDAPSVRIAFTLGGDQRVDLAPGDAGLVITVAASPGGADGVRSGSGRTGGIAVASSDSPEPAATDSPKIGSGSRVIVLDPGHGGGDAGTQHNGLVEKYLTLDIAQRLRALLVAQGWSVRMTREGDVDPISNDNLARMRADGKPNPDDRAYLQTRCDVANNANARLFISIHINSAPSPTPRGTTVYWYKPQDAALAQAIERGIVPLAGTQDDGSRHENFYVVRHTAMPAVLVETAFVTNPGDVALLRQPSFLQNVAQGIANGVKAYAGSPPASLSAQ